MEKLVQTSRKAINPWAWQDKFGFVQANKITDAKNILVCAGQISVNENGEPIHAGDMSAQINQVFDNLERVLSQSGFTLSAVFSQMPI